MERLFYYLVVPPRLSPETTAEIMRLAKLEPLEPYPGATAHWQCRCMTCENIVTPRFWNVRNGHTGCVHCAGQARITETEALKNFQKAGLIPRVPYPGKNKPWPSTCNTCGSEVAPRLNDIRKGQGGCRKCADETRAARQRHPSATAVKIMQEGGFEPLEDYTNIDHPWLCRCLTCGKESRPRLKGVKRLGQGCRWCTGNVPTDAGERLKVMRIANLEPLEPFPGRYAPWRCECKGCGQEVTPAYHNIRNGQGGCATCSDGAFDSSKPAILYLITHERHLAHKIGITRVGGSRLQLHRDLGWQVFRTKLFERGGHAKSVERKVLYIVRKGLRLPVYLSKTEMPQGGYQETVGAEAISLIELWELVNTHTR